nr:hypothetical protein [Tanacetum cinerariifolium]
MANTIPLVTTVMKPTNDPGEANTAPRVNIQELCEEYYEDILPIIMEKARHERLKDVHARLDFGEEDDLTKPWTCEEVNPFTPRIHNFESLRKKRMPNNIKTYDGTGDPEDHVKIFQAAAQVERWSMPTWCHMFNSTLIGAARKKYVKDPVEIHNIKQREGETLEDFMKRFKIETGPAAASKKKGHGSWKPQDQSKKHADKRPDLRGHSRDGRGTNRFTPLTRTPKEILAAEANKFQPPPPMVTPIEKRNSNKFCDFHNDKGYGTDECMQLKKQIEELVRAGKLSHLIKEMKQGREQTKTGRKEAVAKDKPTKIYMVRSWQRTVKQKITQSFEQGKEITFPPLTTNDGTEGPLVIEAEWADIQFTRRDYMAARTTKTPGDHRRHHPFYQSMDELHDCKVVVTLQRYHRTTEIKSDTSGTIYSSRNAKIPDRRGDRNNSQLPIDTC